MIQIILTIALLVVMVVLALAAIGLAWQYYDDKKSVLRYGTVIADGPFVCEACEHPFGEHLLVNKTGNPLDGGEMFCPNEGCTCRSIWSVKQKVSSS